jgi:fermentation-respiration switch protein FrsA (DUF1100 family)
MTLLVHQLYEINKGVRHLALLTLSLPEALAAASWLKSQHVASFLQPVGAKRANLFFGRSDCVEVVRRLAGDNLKSMTDEEDFMLGVLLGYDQRQQCKRYLKRKTRSVPANEEMAADSARDSSVSNEVPA